MDIYLKTVAGAMIALVLCLILSKRDKDISLLLSVAACCMILGISAIYLKPVLDFLIKLQTVGKLDGEIIEILFRVVGIGLIAEISALICSDVGNSALGKALQIVASALVLYISMPLFSWFLDIVTGILGEF